MARAKLRKAEETSALETDDTEEAVQKSRQKRKKVLSDIDDPVMSCERSMKAPKKPPDALLPLPPPPQSLLDSSFISPTTTAGIKLQVFSQHYSHYLLPFADNKRSG